MSKGITHVCIALSIAAIVLSSVNIYLILDKNHISQEQFDYVIFQDQDLVKAENKKERTIDFSSRNASLVINQAIDQGNDIYIEGGNYSLTSNIHIFNRKDVKITSNNANLTCNGNKIIIKGDDYTKSQRNLLLGLKIINGTVRIDACMHHARRSTIATSIYKIIL